ncbi:MAG: LLM class flavin-dependent oxidoreductase [Deltaproteobacteria bacterium]|nr:LLM class flavin-dependent oxidoreductase [Deltaproteobacteria bacterium]MBW2360680.1 LLM class flavin-dependent oxidoreductase [Deltaproteobacteria bacterium]
MYPHALPGPALLEEMCAQARLAEAAGFDGLMTSEHHGGFPGYLPNPLQLAGWILEATDRVWAAPSPLLLPLKHWSHVAEEIAWLACRFPGRVGAGFAMGGLARDFEMADLRFEDKLERFGAALPRIVEALSGKAVAPLADDRAIARCREAPIPLVSAAQGPGAVRRAARVGIGLLFDSLQSPERVGELTGIYRDAGGGAGACLIRRIWVGAPPSPRYAEQRRFYESYTDERIQKHWGGDELVSGADASEVAEKLSESLRVSRCDSINLRVHVTGLPPEEARDQIRRVGAEVLPRLRSGLGRIPLDAEADRAANSGPDSSEAERA